MKTPVIKDDEAYETTDVTAHVELMFSEEFEAAEKELSAFPIKLPQVKREKEKTPAQ